MKSNTEVVIIGGSLVGLSAAMFLAWQGVKTIVIEKHGGSSTHPRALGYSQRTMELFRAVGITKLLPCVNKSFTGRPRRIKVECMNGKWFSETLWTPKELPSKNPSQDHHDGDVRSQSPETKCAISQDVLEPVLRQRAIDLGAEIRVSTEMIDFTDLGDEVIVIVKNKITGEEDEIKAKYLIGADGNQSSVREKLKIERKGKGKLQVIQSVLFKAERLDDFLKSGFGQFMIEREDFHAFLTTYGESRWALMFYDDVERSDEMVKQQIINATGIEDLQFELLIRGRWELTALICDKFQSGNVLLAGDSAHTLPPNRGGYGANTGIEDAHNLAWKISSVLRGKSNSDLLSTYDEERRPFAWLRFQQIFARDDYSKYATDDDSKLLIDDDAMELGQLYQSSSIINDCYIHDLEKLQLPTAKTIIDWKGQPGTRAPHFYSALNNDHISMSLIDLFYNQWTFISCNDRWRSIIDDVKQSVAVLENLQFIQIGFDFIPQNEDKEVISESFGWKDFSGISLIRPDGYIAWRLPSFPAEGEPPLLLLSVLKRSAFLF